MIKLKDVRTADKIKLALLIAAVVILAAVLVSDHRRGKSSVRGSISGRQAASVAGGNKKYGTSGMKKKPQEIEALMRSVGRADPFLPVTGEYAETGMDHTGLHLSGVVSDGKRTLAIINGALLGEGDVIEGKKILKIDDESVVVMKEDGEEHTLKLWEK